MLSVNSSNWFISTSSFCAGVVSGVALYSTYNRWQQYQSLHSIMQLNDCNPSSIRHPIMALTDIIIRYHKKLRTKNDTYAVQPCIVPGTLMKALPTKCPEGPESYADIFKDCEKHIFPALTHWQSPNFFAYFKVRASDPSVLADLLCASLNVVGFTYVSAPAATELEQIMCNWLGQMIGLPSSYLFTNGSIGGGVIQGTASESALVAMIAARERTLSYVDRKERAIMSGKLCVYVSDQTHAIVEKACMILQIPHLRVISTKRGVADVDNYGLDPADLQKAINDDLEKELIPFFVVPTVGTTSTTAIDPVEEIAKVAKNCQSNIWVHIDGAYGGCAAVCPEFQQWFHGVARCDSICINPHKWLLIGMDCSVLWVKNRTHLNSALSLTPVYLQQNAEQRALTKSNSHDFSDVYDPVDYKNWQIPLGRRFRSLKLWFTFRRYGVQGLRDNIRHSIHLAETAARELQSDGRFKLFVPVRMGLVCFYINFGGKELNEQLLKSLNDTGKVFLTHSVVDGQYILRLAVGGLECSVKDILNAVSLIRSCLTTISGSQKNE